MTTMDSPLPATATEAADSQPPTDGPMGLAAVPGSELVVPAAIEAINGYLKNRYLLCEQLAEISSLYEREKDRRKCIENQIDIIDRCVIAVLYAQNAEVVAPPPNIPSLEKTEDDYGNDRRGTAGV